MSSQRESWDRELAAKAPLDPAFATLPRGDSPQRDRPVAARDLERLKIEIGFARRLLRHVRPRRRSCGPATSSRLIVLDEPSEGLASIERAILGSVLKTLTRDVGLTAVLVERDLDFVRDNRVSDCRAQARAPPRLEGPRPRTGVALRRALNPNDEVGAKSAAHPLAPNKIGTYAAHTETWGSNATSRRPRRARFCRTRLTWRVSHHDRARRPCLRRVSLCVLRVLGGDFTTKSAAMREA